jgi:hypothetical protein
MILQPAQLCIIQKYLFQHNFVRQLLTYQPAIPRVRYSEVSRLVHDLALGFRTGRVSVSLSFCLLSLGFTAAGASEQRTLGIADPNPPVQLQTVIEMYVRNAVSVLVNGSQTDCSMGNWG